MAKFIANDVKVVVNGVTLSDHAFSVDTPSEKEQIDVSGFNPSNTKEFLPGQKEESVTIQFLQDFAASSVHATLEPLYRNGTQFVLTLTPDSDTAVSATNPTLSGSVVLQSYNGLSAELGQRAEITATFTPSTSTGLVWGTV